MCENQKHSTLVACVLLWNLQRLYHPNAMEEFLLIYLKWYEFAHVAHYPDLVLSDFHLFPYPLGKDRPEQETVLYRWQVNAEFWGKSSTIMETKTFHMVQLVPRPWRRLHWKMICTFIDLLNFLVIFGLVFLFYKNRTTLHLELTTYLSVYAWDLVKTCP